MTFSRRAHRPLGRSGSGSASSRSGCSCGSVDLAARPPGAAHRDPGLDRRDVHHVPDRRRLARRPLARPPRPDRAIPYRRVLGYTYIGYLANNVLPARLGELVRSHSLGEKEGVARTTVLGTVVVERVVDTVMVVAIAAVPSSS